MKIDKLLRKADSLFNGDERDRKEKKKCLKHLVKKLKKNEKSLIAQLEAESDISATAKIKQEIALVHAQRKKGLKVLKSLKNA